MKKVKRPGYEVTLEVSMQIDRRDAADAGETEKALRVALKGADVKIKSGPLENLAMGVVTAIKEVRTCTITYTEER